MRVHPLRSAGAPLQALSVLVTLCPVFWTPIRWEVAGERARLAATMSWRPSHRTPRNRQPSSLGLPSRLSRRPHPVRLLPHQHHLPTLVTIRHNNNNNNNKATPFSRRSQCTQRRPLAPHPWAATATCRIFTNHPLPILSFNQPLEVRAVIILTTRIFGAAIILERYRLHSRVPFRERWEEQEIEDN